LLVVLFGTFPREFVLENLSVPYNSLVLPPFLDFPFKFTVVFSVALFKVEPIAVPGVIVESSELLPFLS
jgi:hypothetical protein